jgi:putative zinc finger/helix-turn-helix YgiT family protein
MKPMALFEYTCPECGLGTVNTTRVLNYKTRIKGYPFVIDEAFIGICNQCGAESFAPEETKRWEDIFYQSLEARQAFLSPGEIAELRTSLGLSMEDFARLIGCTRQSISAWEKRDRPSPPLRMADLLMKLVRRSLQVGPVDVISFLLEEAKKWGVVIEIRKIAASLEERSIVLRPKHVRQSTLPEQTRGLALAAETSAKEEESIVVETADGKVMGILGFDFERAALILELTGDFSPWKSADVEIETRGGRHFTVQGLSLEQRRLVLMEKTEIGEGDVSQITLKLHHQEKR